MVHDSKLDLATCLAVHISLLSIVHIRVSLPELRVAVAVGVGLDAIVLCRDFPARPEVFPECNLEASRTTHHTTSLASLGRRPSLILTSPSLFIRCLTATPETKDKGGSDLPG